MAEYIERQIRSVPRNATVAVIAPNMDEAEFWFKLLEDELSSGHRPPRLSRRDDLTRRVNVHFTEVKETKGLEFDVTVIPDFGAFSLSTEIGRNQAYVAISRPKQSLILGCHEKNATLPEIEVLKQSKLVQTKNLIVH
jgi:DNA helicase IV